MTATIALVGCPNVGKSTLFGTLTGLRRRCGNWSGTSVDAGRGTWLHHDRRLSLIDLPGTYSLDPLSPDEGLTRALLVDLPQGERPDVVVVVVNAADLVRGLRLFVQVRQEKQRVVVALTMSDIAARRGMAVDHTALAEVLGVPVVLLDPRNPQDTATLAEALTLVLDDAAPAPLAITTHDEADGGEDGWSAWIGAVTTSSVRHDDVVRCGGSDRIDRIVTSPVVGPLLFLAIMWTVIHLATIGATPLVAVLDQALRVQVAGNATTLVGEIGLKSTWVEGLVIDGLVVGVGTVLSFVPLLTLLYALLATLESTGYLARAAVVAARLMRIAGLPGRAFIPFLVGFGCNVPAIRATRALPDPRHRRLTALLVPFTSCGARLPVYVLIGTAVFTEHAGAVLFTVYLSSVAFIVLGGLLLRAPVLRGTRREPLVVDLPPYQLPRPRTVLLNTWSQLTDFLRSTTGVILVSVTAVWLLSATPANREAGSFGKVGIEDSVFATTSSAVASVLAPAGLDDWRLSGGLLAGVVTKEAVISSWAQTYHTDEPASAARSGALASSLRKSLTTASDGHPGPAGLALLLLLIGYAPCVATIAAQVRENGVRWTLAGVGTCLVTSWVVAVTVFQVGKVIT